MKPSILKKSLEDVSEFIRQEGHKLAIDTSDLEQIQIAAEAEIRVTFPSLTTQLELIRRTTKEISSFLPFTEAELDDIALAIDEACANIINHSYAGNPGIIRVHYALKMEQLRIVIVDEGEQGHLFNPDKLSSYDKEKYLKTLSKGGLGVYIIKKIMDEVEYTVTPGKQNCLTMVKYLHKLAK